MPGMAGREDRLNLALAPETREVGPEGTPEHTEGYSTPLAETPQAHTLSPQRQSDRLQGFEPPPLPPPIAAPRAASSESPEREPVVVAPPEDDASGWDRVGAGVRWVGAGVERAADKAGGSFLLGMILAAIVTCVSSPPPTTIGLQCIDGPFAYHTPLGRSILSDSCDILPRADLR